MSIGAFAALTGLPITTLRHYDDIRLIVPAFIDPVTAYRWYSPMQATRAGLIRRLRGVGVPLDDLGDLLAEIGSPDQLAARLASHEARLADDARVAIDAQDQFATLAKELLAMSTTPPDTTALLGPIRAVRIFCRELAVARRFYRDQLRLSELTATSDWLVYDAGGVQIVVEVASGEDTDGEDAAESPDSARLVGRFCGISFAVDDAARVCAELVTVGVDVVGAPEQMAWGGTLAHIADPDGNVLTLVQYPH